MMFPMFLVIFLATVGCLIAGPVPLAPHVWCERGSCGAGFYFSEKDQSCHNCHAGTYQAVSGHKCTDCALCSEPSEFEEVKEPCTAQQDTVRVCKAGYFKTGNPILPECDRCQSCTEDEILVQPCGERHDAKCVKKTQFLDNGKPGYFSAGAAVLNKESKKNTLAWNLLVIVVIFIILTAP